MIEIIAIGLNTFREAIRNKVLYLILLFGVLLIGSSLFLSTLALEANLRVIKNLGLAAINLFGLLVAMFIGVNLIPQELESKTIYTIVSQGIRRWQFVLGKFLGLLLTVYANVVLMALVMIGTLVYFHLGADSAAADMATSFPWLLRALGMQLLEMLVVCSVAILFSAFSTPILSAVLTLMVYTIGQMTNDFWNYIRIESEKEGTELFTGFLTVIWYLCPHLDMLNLRKVYVHLEVLDDAQKIVPVFQSMLHSFSYTGAILFLACWAFSKREF